MTIDIILTMLPYIAIFFAPLLAMAFERTVSKNTDVTLWISYSAFLVFFVGFRINLGTDWSSYQGILESSSNIPFTSGLLIVDPGYAVINWIGANYFGRIYLPNVVCALLAVIPLMLFCRSRANPWLSLTVAVPYLVIVVYMGYTRQSAAIGLCILAILSLERERFWSAIGLVMLASLFHLAAAGFFMPVIVLSGFPLNRRNTLRAAGAAVVSAIYLIVTLVGSGRLAWRVEAYLAAPTAATDAVIGVSFRSLGALPRLGLGFLAGAAFIWLVRKQPRFNPRNGIWTLCAVGSFTLLPLALVTSTFADRIGLFLVPLQLQAVSLLDANFKPLAARLIFRTAVVVLYGALLMVWLTRSRYAQYWLPYDNLLFHLL